MPLRDILVSVDNSEYGRQRVDFALKLARDHGAHLTGYFTSPSAGETPVGWAGDIAESAEREFMEQLGAGGGRWLLSGEPIAEDIASYIRDCDLAVLGLGDPARELPEPQGFVVEDVVLRCGRPVLGMPISTPPENFVTTALVAWDGSREAARALNDALPLLEKAKTVEIASLGSRGGELAARAIEHLARHGIKATEGSPEPIYPDVGDELLRRAEAIEADLVITGAYGHSQLAEAIFGGASRTMFRQMLVPTLFSH